MPVRMGVDQIQHVGWVVFNCRIILLYYSAAEGFYKQALQTLKLACGDESPQVLKVLEC